MQKYILILFVISSLIACQRQLSGTRVQLNVNAAAREVAVQIGGAPFTTFMYADSLPKQVLWPIYAPGGVEVTRGFPIKPKPGERTDHPHHLGHWFNHGDVNGLDFWNNSYAIPAAKKHLYGSIRHKKIVSAKSGAKGVLHTESEWCQPDGKAILKEDTKFTFSAEGNTRFIDRTTVLTALTNVTFKDTKEGMLAIRVARFLEMPSNQPDIFVDAAGIPTKVPVLNNEGVTGLYRNSNGQTGNDAWGQRADWCQLSGKQGDKTVTITITDDPANPRHPARWHARGYGLFAVNPFGEKSYTNQGESLKIELKPGESRIFRFRIAVEGK
jgi:Methane oxygenase PmoA